MRVPICPNSISETQQGNQETYTAMWRESPFPSPPPHHPQIMMAKCASVYLIYSFVDLSLGRKRGWDGNSQSRPVSEKNDLNKILQVELYNCKFLNLEDCRALSEKAVILWEDQECICVHGLHVCSLLSWAESTAFIRSQVVLVTSRSYKPLLVLPETWESIK